ncbi:MAG: hypothetical protein ACLQA5_09125 [Solirubrobacteraceae bacterium]
MANRRVVELSEDRDPVTTASPSLGAAHEPVSSPLVVYRASVSPATRSPAAARKPVSGPLEPTVKLARALNERPAAAIGDQVGHRHVHPGQHPLD